MVPLSISPTSSLSSLRRGAVALACLVVVSFPAAAQLELTPNDQRISFHAGTGDPTRDALDPEVAWNPNLDEYLVVWWGSEPTAASTNVFEIFGQFVDGDGTLLGAAFQISVTGPPGDHRYEATHPAVAFNATTDEYLVVWRADLLGLTTEFEIYGQLVSDAGALMGGPIRISDMGSDGDPTPTAESPAVVWNPLRNEFLVAWAGNDDNSIKDLEIFVQRIDDDGNEVGTNDRRISDAGDTGVAGFTVTTPAVVHNATDDEYLVVWRGEDDVGGLAPSEFEIFGQLLAWDGAELRGNDLRLSDAGGLGDSSYTVVPHPSVAWSPETNEYLVVWGGDEDISPLVENENEIFGQLLDADGNEVGANDFRISDMGPDGDTSFGATEVDVVWNAAASRFVVVWQGIDDADGQVSGEWEIHAQLVDGGGLQTGPNDLRISDMGGLGSPTWDAASPAVAAGPGSIVFVLWESDDDLGGLVDNEFEIFGQRLDLADPLALVFADGFESGNTTAWQ